jgi:CHASE3 domain sensor protein
MSSHSIRTQSNSALHRPRASVEATTIFDLATVTAVVSAIAYIAAIMIGWL